MSLFENLPDTATYTDEEFRTSGERVRRARESVLKEPVVAEAAKQLKASIDEHVAKKRATLSQVRQALGLTQKQLADTLNMDQGEISRLEHRENIHLTTLSRFIEATGGRLRLVAVYDDAEIDLEIGDIAPSASLLADA